MRDYAFYLDKAKEVQGFKYDNQVDAALGFKGAMACQIRKNKNSLSPEKMIELAELGKQNPLIALIDHNVMNSSGPVKKTYATILQKISHAALVVAVLGAFAADTSPAYASNEIANNVYYGNNIHCYFGTVF